MLECYSTRVTFLLGITFYLQCGVLIKSGDVTPHIAVIVVVALFLPLDQGFTTIDAVRAIVFYAQDWGVNCVSSL